MICSNCGKEIEGGKFCPFCGTAVEAPEAEAPAEEAAPEVKSEEPAAEAAAEETPAAEAPAAEAPAEEAAAEEAPAEEAPAEEPAAEDAPVIEETPASEEAAAEAAPAEPSILEPVEAISSEVTEVAPIENPTETVASPIDIAPAPAPAPAEGPAAGPAAEPAPVEAPVAAAPVEAKPKKSKKPLIIALSIIGAVIILAGAGIGIFYYLLVQKYNKATDAFDNGDYEQSLQLYTELQTFKFKDSEYWAQCSQVELDYQKVDGLIEQEDFDGAITILDEVIEFYEDDSKSDEALALKTECETVKEAFADKSAKNYFEAKNKFTALTTLKDKYAVQVNLCDAHLAENNKAWMTIIANLYGIQTKDLDLAFIKAPKTDDDKFISEAFDKGTTDYDKINSVVKPADDEQKALLETAIKGLKYDNAVQLVEKLDFEKAMAIFTELGDFLDSKAQYDSAKSKMDELNKKYDAAQALYDNGEYYKAMVAWNEISEWKDSADKAKSCKQTMPDNGSLKKGSGSISMKINAPSSINALLRVYNSSGEVVAQTFIAAGKSTTIKLGAGTYTIKVAYGTEWYGEKDLFGAKGAYLQLKNGTSETFSLKKNYTYTLTLQSGTSGNVGSKTVSGGAEGM
ncbi:MAG: hypothetical protein IIT90_03755 [Clostridiales bacterium]|nr:hypothetical protein [Clostridiales bacterium]